MCQLSAALKAPRKLAMEPVLLLQHSDSKTSAPDPVICTPLNSTLGMAPHNVSTGDKHRTSDKHLP